MEKKSQVVNMRYPVELLKQIDNYKNKGGFLTRTDAIFTLIRKGLNQVCQGGKFIG